MNPPTTSLVDMPPTHPRSQSCDVQVLARRLSDSLSITIAGRSEQIRQALVVVLAGGHLLIEDVPGVGKTLFAQSLATSIGGTLSRVQGTNDLLPGDVLGFLAPSVDRSRFEFRHGPIFANVVLFDELNRTTPRTQSALFEVMEEARVSVDGASVPTPQPMVLIATKNPTDQVGTAQLSEGAADRFMLSISLGQASADEELAVVTGRVGRGNISRLEPVCTPDQLVAAQAVVRAVHLPDVVGRYAVELTRATRTHPHVRLGASTRAAVAMVAAARANAAIEGRDFVTPDDVHRHAVAVLAHRLRTVDGDSTSARGVAQWALAMISAPRV
jgi:MoxR-like ATPase